MTAPAVDTSPFGIALDLARKGLTRSEMVDTEDHIALLGAHANLRESMKTLIALVEAREAVRAA